MGRVIDLPLTPVGRGLSNCSCDGSLNWMFWNMMSLCHLVTGPWTTGAKMFACSKKKLLHRFLRYRQKAQGMLPPAPTNTAPSAGRELTYLRIVLSMWARGVLVPALDGFPVSAPYVFGWEMKIGLADLWFHSELPRLESALGQVRSLAYGVISNPLNGLQMFQFRDNASIIISF